MLVVQELVILELVVLEMVVQEELAMEVVKGVVALEVPQEMTSSDHTVHTVLFIELKKFELRKGVYTLSPTRSTLLNEILILKSFIVNVNC